MEMEEVSNSHKDGRLGTSSNQLCYCTQGNLKTFSKQAISDTKFDLTHQSSSQSRVTFDIIIVVRAEYFESDFQVKPLEKQTQ